VLFRSLITGQQYGTLFAPGEKLKSRKHWLAFTAKTRGRIVFDAGAAEQRQAFLAPFDLFV